MFRTRACSDGDLLPHSFPASSFIQTNCYRTNPLAGFCLMSLCRTAGALQRPVRPYVRIFAPYAESAAIILNARSYAYRSKAARSPLAENRVTTQTTAQDLPPAIGRHLSRTIEDAERLFNRHGRTLYDSARISGQLPPISFDTFRYLANRLIQATFKQRPTAQAARMISKGVELCILHT